VVNAEEYWPDMEGLDHRDTVTDFTLPEGTFFDCATVRQLTTATLDRLRELSPQGRFEIRRFRPNIVVQLESGEHSFAENAWVGHTLAIGQGDFAGAGQSMSFCVKTHDVELLPEAPPGAGDANTVPGIVRSRSYLGAHCEYVIDIGQDLLVATPPAVNVAPGSKVRVRFHSERCRGLVQ
jgi:hypothetical protein